SGLAQFHDFLFVLHNRLIDESNDVDRVLHAGQIIGWRDWIQGGRYRFHLLPAIGMICDTFEAKEETHNATIPERHGKITEGDQQQHGGPTDYSRNGSP
ncbi:MAG: hypothetical protein WCE23_05635, partial [Candidatus Binatus sp.]